MNPTGKGGHRDYRIIKATKPSARPIRGANSKYPLIDLEVGDSFIVPPEEAGGARTAAYLVSRAHNVKFTTRTLADGSVQVWRVRLDGQS